MILNVAAILFMAAIGCALCQVTHIRYSVKELLTAASIALISSQLALIPFILTRGADQAAVSQAALVATVAHLLVCASAGLGAASMLHMSHSYLYWLCAFYWATIASVAAAAVKAVKAAPSPAVGIK